MAGMKAEAEAATRCFSLLTRVVGREMWVFFAFDSIFAPMVEIRRGSLGRKRPRCEAVMMLVLGQEAYVSSSRYPG